MNPIRIITASAGSGKTYRLAEELYDAVSSGDARPEAILATTFTVKVASELKQRVRGRLLKSGLCAEAERLGAARFGTVNAVCERLVDEYAFELGLPPGMSVLDEEAADRTMREVISSVLTDDEVELAGRLDQAFQKWEWREVVGEIVAHARSNGIPAEALPGFAERSREGCLALLGRPESDGTGLERKLIEAGESFLEVFPSLSDPTSTTGGIVSNLRLTLRKLREGPVAWKEWARLASANTGVRSRDAFAVVSEAASAHDRHPGLRSDVTAAIDLVFELAGRSMREYQTYKQTHGVIDFPDQEMYALELLDRPDVRERLSHEIDLVLVDEFQDTSPIQLAIFLRLASIARRSVWVGDQKQSIFGFRGTDPSLIDAVIEKVSADSEPESLPRSWRSRPGLVKLTSELFAPPFAEVGIPRKRVCLDPAVEEPAEGLGEIVERWVLDSRNKRDDAPALSEALSNLLADEEVSIRDPGDGAVRRLRPGDVAILCWTNATCTSVTKALESSGIRVCMPRPALLATLEGRLATAGLRLWADPGDSLAQAEIAYLTEYPDNGDAWLTRVVEKAGDRPFEDNPAVAAILQARAARPGASPVEALDAVIESARLVEICHRWGNTPARLANLEKLRSHAVLHQAGRLEEGAAATVVGFYQHLMALVEAQGDDQGEASGQDAVTVSTWHRAKGLEWPVTVLFELDKKPRDNPALGVHALTDGTGINLDDPLAGRWIRYWPYPYGDTSSGIPFNERLAACAENVSAVERERREHLRLLYVGWTRARDRLVLAGRKKALAAGMVSLLKTGGAEGVTEPESDEVTWAGIPVRVKQRMAAPAESPAPPSAPGMMLPEGTPREYPPAVIHPSSLEILGTAGEPAVLGEPTGISGSSEWADLGNAVHGFFAADREGYPIELRREIARRLLEGWGVSSSLTVDSLIEMSSRLHRWIGSNWPGAVRSSEVPLTMQDENGSIITGTADMVLDLGDRIVLIDHKTFPGSRTQAVEEAIGYAGQLGAYRRMLEASTGKPVIACYIHCPVPGIVVPVLST